MAMREELGSMEAAGVWGPPTILPAGKTATPLKFIFTKKMGPGGEVERYKARLVFLNREKGNVSNGERLYAPVVEKTTLRMFLAYAASHHWWILQADVCTAFLHAENSGEDYVLLPSGLEELQHGGGRIRRLHKALYGLRRAPKAWNDFFTAWAVGEEGYIQSSADLCLFYSKDRSGMLVVYVDDLLLAAVNQQVLTIMLEGVNSKFEVRNMGTPSYFLGINVCYDRERGEVPQTSVQVVTKVAVDECFHTSR
jgi:hypothetical protein